MGNCCSQARVKNTRICSFHLSEFGLGGYDNIIRLVLDVAGVPYVDDTCHQALDEVGEPDLLRWQQSRAVARYLAALYGVVGSGASDVHHIDFISDIILDLSQQLRKMYFKQLHDKEEEFEEFCRTYLPIVFSHLDMFLEANQRSKDYFVGDKLSWADLVFAYECQWLDFLDINPGWNRRPELRTLRGRLLKHPKIKARLQNHPTFPR